VRSVGGTVYFMGTNKFWTQQGGQSAAQLFAGRWVSTAVTSKSGQSLGQFLNSTSFMKSLFGSNLKSSTFAFAGKSKVNGQSTTVISGRDKTGKAAGDIYISSNGSGYILRITFAGKTTGALNFSKFNAPVTPVAPTGAIDLDTLSNSSSG
jgi:hemin uptake protein HemP